MRKEGNSNICYNMNELKDTVLSEKHQQQKCCMILFYEVHRVGRFIEAEKMVVAGAWCSVGTVSAGDKEVL